TENRCRSRQPTPVQVQPELRAKRFGTVVKSSVGCEISRQGLIKSVGAPCFPGLIRLLSLISLACHEPIQPGGQDPVAHNRLDRREPNPQLPPGMAWHRDNRRCRPFRLKEWPQGPRPPAHPASASAR